MYCSNCGKEVDENDNYCRNCGNHLQRIVIKNSNDDDVEEIVLYDVKKHWINLVPSVFFTPLFFFYFWNIFLNTHSFFSWVVMAALLGFIFYPIARYKSDKIVITNKYAHLKCGVINPEEVNIPLDKIDLLEVTQSSFGKTLGYGLVTYIAWNEKLQYGCIVEPEELEYIIENPQKFVEENMD